MIILEIILISIAVISVAAYFLRDKTQDEYKQQQFINSITGGPLDGTKHTHQL